MPVQTYGVTPDSVRLLYFPTNDPPSASTSPSLSAQTSMVQEEAAELEGALELQAIDPATVFARGATEAPYLWCAKTLGLMVAIRVAEVSRGSDTELLKRWRERVEARLEALASQGASALGDSTLETSASPIAGPTTHITEFNLDTGDDTQLSSTAPIFRKDDWL